MPSPCESVREYLSKTLLLSATSHGFSSLNQAGRVWLGARASCPQARAIVSRGSQHPLRQRAVCPRSQRERGGGGGIAYLVTHFLRAEYFGASRVMATDIL